MKCLPYVDLDTDTAYWVSKDNFFNHFNQHDFNHYREAETVIQAYLREWFYINKKGDKCFILPTVQYVNGATEFISGRHRTAVLLEHLNELPIAFAQPIDGDNSPILKIVDRLVNISEPIWLPDLKDYNVLP